MLALVRISPPREDGDAFAMQTGEELEESSWPSGRLPETAADAASSADLLPEQDNLAHVVPLTQTPPRSWLC